MSPMISFRLFVPGFKKKEVAEGNLTPEMGLTKRSPIELATAPDPLVVESHTDWWAPMDVSPEGAF